MLKNSKLKAQLKWTKDEIRIKRFSEYETATSVKSQVGNVLNVPQSVKNILGISRLVGKGYTVTTTKEKLQSRKMMSVWIWTQEMAKTEVLCSTYRQRVFIPEVQQQIKNRNQKNHCKPMVKHKSACRIQGSILCIRKRNWRKSSGLPQTMDTNVARNNIVFDVRLYSISFDMNA